MYIWSVKAPLKNVLHKKIVCRYDVLTVKTIQTVGGGGLIEKGEQIGCLLISEIYELKI